MCAAQIAYEFRIGNGIVAGGLIFHYSKRQYSNIKHIFSDHCDDDPEKASSIDVSALISIDPWEG